MVATFQEPGESPTKQAEHPPYTWHSPQRRANWTLNLVALHILIMIASIASNWFEINFIRSIQDGNAVTEAAITSNATRQAIIAVLYTISYIAVVIPFLMWIYRASKNLSALGASKQNFSPSWAVWWWFIPIADLWKPYNVTAEIWVESHPERHRPPAWFTVWWATWIVSIVLGYFPFIASAINLNEIIPGDSLETASDAICIAGALCLIILVRRITANQIQKHQTSADQDYPNPSPPEDQHTRPIQPSRRRQQYRPRHNYLQRWLLP